MKSVSSKEYSINFFVFKLALEKVLSHPTSAMTPLEKSLCNPIGYLNHEDQDICIHAGSLDVGKADDAIGVKRQRCNQGTEQQWAINGSHICHPVKDICMTVARHSDNILVVLLMQYNSTERAQKWRLDKETNQIVNEIKNDKNWLPSCMDISTTLFDKFGYPYFVQRKCDKNKWSQKWNFTPIMDTNNHQVCAGFNERRGTHSHMACLYISIFLITCPLIYLIKRFQSGRTVETDRYRGRHS